MRSTDTLLLPLDMPAVEAPARGRPPKLGPMEEIAIVEARQSNTPWKILEQRYGMARSKLHDAYQRGLNRISGHIS